MRAEIRRDEVERYNPELGLESVPCNLCGSTSTTQVLAANTSLADLRAAAFACTSPDVGQHGTIVRCDNCGLVYTNPRPTAELLDALYADVEDNVYLEDEEARVATFRHALVGVRKRAPGGRLLDIGSHVGTFLQLAREAGYDVSGVEPSTWAAEYARNTRGLDVRPCGLTTAGFEPESFDVVTMWDVIEHFADPKEELRQVHGVLKPGGLFALTTMDVGALLPRVLRGRWPWYMLMHQYFFTPQTLSRMLDEVGFEVIAIEPHIRITYVRYVASKLEAYSRGLHRVATLLTEKTGIGGMRIPVNLGDLMTVYARKR
ncbi:MAG: class I SAM-dependent methyltransferase [Chloroflexota bacterium]|nr:class I SAM-dependent methyltransferase [Chloroflexota bacterium]